MVHCDHKNLAVQEHRLINRWAAGRICARQARGERPYVREKSSMQSSGKQGFLRMRRQVSGHATLDRPADIALTPDLGLTAHEGVYRELRDRILFGGIRPGAAVTLRGLAEDLGVSPMPVREAVRRLLASGALDLQDNRRVVVPPMTRERFDQILFARRALVSLHQRCGDRCHRAN
jgi:DNA-binding transcriptional regulator YhcF (GntR family)